MWRLGLLVLAGCGRLGFEPSADAPTPPGLVLWLAGEDDPADGTLDDSSGNRHDAQCVPSLSCPTRTSGRHGNALAFDGTQYARITYGSWAATPSGFTIAAFMYLDVQVSQVAFAKPWGSSAGDSWDIVAWAPTTGTGTCFESMNGAGNRESVCATAALPAGQWFHLAGRWDGQAKALFIDGTKTAELDPAPIAQIDTNDLIIGADQNAGVPEFMFHGKLDDLQVYDRALSDAELANLAR